MTIGYVFVMIKGNVLIAKSLPVFITEYFIIGVSSILTLAFILLLLAITKQIGLSKARQFEMPLLSVFDENDFRNGDIFLWSYQEQRKNLVLEYYSPIPPKFWNEKISIIEEQLAIQIIDPIRRRKKSEKATSVIVMLAKKGKTTRDLPMYDMELEKDIRSINL